MNTGEHVPETNDKDIKPIEHWGTIHCAECDGTIAFFPPEIRIKLHDDLPLYCGFCAENLSVEGN